MVLRLLTPAKPRSARRSLPPRAGRTLAAVLLLALASGCGREPAPPPLEAAPARSARSASQPPPPREEQGSEAMALRDQSRRDFDRRCLRAGCHADLTKVPWVHGPAAVDACDLCHRDAGRPEEHRFVPARAKEQLCAFCHRPQEPLAVRHEPFNAFECTACHDPHGGTSPTLMSSMLDVCRKCHPREDLTFPHEPVAQGDCLSCHAAHQSEHERLLAVPEKTLCLNCHPRYIEALEKAARVHEPVAKGCTMCHFAHGAERARLLRAEPRELCLSCHAAVAEGAASARSAHGFSTGATACTSCHRPHTSEFQALLSAPAAELCYGCHDRDIFPSSSRRIPDIRGRVAGASSVHAPVAAGDCTTCHLAHHSPNRALLRLPYPEDTYARFSPAAYEACFSCHDRRLALEAETEATGFRDGRRNLHFVHVNREKGRSCSVCHDPHASPNPKLVRERFPFGPGGWEMPIRFRKTAKGGSCTTGCHKDFSYEISEPEPGPAVRKGASG